MKKVNAVTFPYYFSLLEKQGIEALFLLSILNYYGIQNDQVDFFVQTRKQKYNFYVRYASILYACCNFKEEEIDFFLNDEKLVSIEAMGKSEPLLFCKGFAKIRTTFASLQAGFVFDQDPFIRRITVRDVPTLLRANYDVEEFKAYNVEPFDKVLPIYQKQVEDGCIVSYAYFEEEEIVSSASSILTTAYGAILGDVFTRKDQRKKGLATRVIKQLLQEISQKKLPTYLTFELETAGRLYHQLGFVDQSNYFYYFRQSN